MYRDYDILADSRDKEAEVQKQKEIGRSQLQQAEKALEEFKLQVEKNQTRIYTETKQQVSITFWDEIERAGCQLFCPQWSLIFTIVYL